MIMQVKKLASSWTRNWRNVFGKIYTQITQLGDQVYVQMRNSANNSQWETHLYVFW